MPDLHFKQKEYISTKGGHFVVTFVPSSQKSHAQLLDSTPFVTSVKASSGYNLLFYCKITNIPFYLTPLTFLTIYYHFINYST